MNKVEYTLVTGINLSLFISAVNKKIAEGWQLSGGVSSMAFTEPSGIKGDLTIQYTQAMTKEQRYLSSEK